MIQRKEERFMGSSCEMPAKPPRCADVGHNPPLPVMFLSGASIELTGKEREARTPLTVQNMGRAEPQELRCDRLRSSGERSPISHATGVPVPPAPLLGSSSARPTDPRQNERCCIKQRVARVCP